jgi:hypothetical protein
MLQRAIVALFCVAQGWLQSSQVDMRMGGGETPADHQLARDARSRRARGRGHTAAVAMPQLPLMVGDALVAVLTLYTAAPDGFTADHGRLVQIVAPHLARGIDAALRTQRASRETVPPEQPGARELRLVASR